MVPVTSTPGPGIAGRCVFRGYDDATNLSLVNRFGAVFLLLCGFDGRDLVGLFVHDEVIPVEAVMPGSFFTCEWFRNLLYDDVRVAFSGCYDQFGQLAVRDLALYGGTIRRIQLEFGVPTGRPCGQEQDLTAVRLHQHLLKAVLSIAAIILIRHIVMTGSPEGGEFQRRFFSCQVE